MSTFIGITCYDEYGRESGTIRRLRREDLERALASLPTFRLVDEGGLSGVKLPGLHEVVMLERNGTLSCQVDPRTDVDLLIDKLRDLASALPNAVIEDEEGDEY